ncbi:MAG: hypothetical protein M1419_09580 [Bacteroidetes bacterium]|nr:hypothetical protein [Bacteroidota bacterium]
MKEQDDPIFVLGNEGSNSLQLIIEDYAFPDKTDFWDGNFLNVKISIKAGGFIGNFNAELINIDFLKFREGLENLYKNLTSTSNIRFKEDKIIIKIKGDGKGHFTSDCIANDDPGIYGNELKFSIYFDQTEIINLIRTIDKIINKFPIKEIEKFS